MLLNFRSLPADPEQWERNGIKISIPSCACTLLYAGGQQMSENHNNMEVQVVSGPRGYIPTLAQLIRIIYTNT